MNTLKNTLRITSALALGLMVSACSDENPAGPVTGSANVLIVHASPNAPAVDIVGDNGAANAVDSLTFPTNTGYVALAPGVRNVKVNVRGSSPIVTAIDANLTLENGKNYTVFAADSVSKIGPIVLVDDLTAPAAGNAHVRFVHLSPDAPAVDVAVTGGAVVFGNTSFLGNKPFTPLPAGTYNLEVRVQGTVPPATAAVLLLPNITLQAGKIYTVFAKGFLGGGGSQALGAEIIANN